MTPFELSVLFFLQLGVILAMCRLCGLVFRHLGQPQVVSEMIAGVVLGPSLLGALAPELSAALFPPQSKPILFAVCQVGLALYMFLIGVEFNMALLRTRARSAVAVSLAGMVVPFALGAALAAALVGPMAGVLAGEAPLFSLRTTAPEAMLFLGAAMSITAFPMLARIIFEQGIAKTSLGTLALAAGSIDDVAAWTVLAVVLASFQGDPLVAWVAIGGGVGFALFALLVLRRLLQPLGERVEREGVMGPHTLAGMLIIVMLSAWFTDIIQVYAVFGAFLAGLAMPRGRFAEELHRQLYPLTTALLLPCFFTYSGLNTKIGLVNTPALWMLAGVVLVIAIAGKGVACWAAARLSGEPPRDAMAIGALMNARGLMELIILNIGLQRGIIEPALFTIMVLMAIVTTLMASPIFRWLYGTPAGPARP